MDEVGAAGLFGSEAPVFPNVKRFPPGAELPRGFAAEEVPPNRPGLEDAVVAGFEAPPNKGVPACALPPAWLLCPPNRVAPD